MSRLLDTDVTVVFGFEEILSSEDTKIPVKINGGK